MGIHADDSALEAVALVLLCLLFLLSVETCTHSKLQFLHDRGTGEETLWGTHNILRNFYLMVSSTPAFRSAVYDGCAPAVGPEHPNQGENKHAYGEFR